MIHTFPLVKRIASTAFAFRGYDLTNLGRTPELLAHSVYGPIVEQFLIEASQLSSDIFHRKVDQRKESAPAARRRAWTITAKTWP